ELKAFDQYIFVIVFFFFQAEDGIRDGHVTGVQTCALPILCPPGDAAALAAALERLRSEPTLRARLGRAARATVLGSHTWDAVARSEERRVGKECRAGWSSEH